VHTVPRPKAKGRLADERRSTSVQSQSRRTMRIFGLVIAAQQATASETWDVMDSVHMTIPQRPLVSDLQSI